MHPRSESEIRRSMLNVTKSERSSMVLPRDLAAVDWPGTVFLGWRDPKAPLRGYLVWDDEPATAEAAGIALRAADSTMSGRISAMCQLCRFVGPANALSLFTAKRVGDAGRGGNTVGTYICADLDCSAKVTGPMSTVAGQPDRMLPVEAKIAGLIERLATFVAEVRR